jgi:hypothetical protein
MVIGPISDIESFHAEHYICACEKLILKWKRETLHGISSEHTAETGNHQI